MLDLEEKIGHCHLKKKKNLVFCPIYQINYENAPVITRLSKNRISKCQYRVLKTSLLVWSYQTKKKKKTWNSSSKTLL